MKRGSVYIMYVQWPGSDGFVPESGSGQSHSKGFVREETKKEPEAFS